MTVSFLLDMAKFHNCEVCCVQWFVKVAVVKMELKFQVGVQYLTGARFSVL